MFQNSVFRLSVNTKKWWKAAGVRAAKTMAQTAVSMLTVGQAAMEVNWVNVLSVSFVAGVISICTSVAGLPENAAESTEIETEIKENETEEVEE